MISSNPASFLLITLSVLGLAACGGGYKKTTPDFTPTPVPPPDATSFTFENQSLSFDYGTEWRVSGQTENSIVLTHKERPGQVLLSAQWVEAQSSGTADLGQLFRNQLDLLSTEVRKLEDIKIGTITAERYASLVSREGQGQTVTMYVLFASGKTAYLVTYSAGPDDFVTYTASANQVISTIKTP